jgi:hypothetical protein
MNAIKSGSSAPTPASRWAAALEARVAGLAAERLEPA